MEFDEDVWMTGLFCGSGKNSRQSDLDAGEPLQNPFFQRACICISTERTRRKLQDPLCSMIDNFSVFLLTLKIIFIKD